MGLAGWWDEQVVPRVIRCACSSPVIMGLRGKVVPLARGAVCEIGCGGGINQQFYDRTRITRFAGLDPSRKGLDYARAALRAAGVEGKLKLGFGEAIPFDDECFDTAVCTFTLCSVERQAQTLAELWRILKPGGRLLFAEHGQAPDMSVQKWQGRIEPVWKPLAGGCHLTRPIAGPIAASGFKVNGFGQGYAPRTPRLFGWMEWGEAVKAA